MDVRAPAPVRRSPGVDPLRAELQRSSPTSARSSRDPRPSIQRNGVDVGAVGLQDEKKPPTFTAVPREGGTVLTPESTAKLAGVIRLARESVPKARTAAQAASAKRNDDVETLNKYFNLRHDEEIKGKIKKFGPSSSQVTARREELVESTKKTLDGILGKVEAGFAKDQAIKDINPKKSGDERGYVNMGSRGFWGSPGDIHLRFSLLDTDPPERLARTLVHEATHKYAGTSDSAYWPGAKFNGLTHKEALGNADSYAMYVDDKGK